MKNKVIQTIGQPSDLDEVGKFVVEHQNNYILTGNNEILSLTWQINYSDSISNSHSCPIKGRTNFSRKNGIVKGYPGWAGRIWIVYKKSRNVPIRLNESRIHMGTGGYGLYNHPHFNNNLYINYYPVSFDFRFYRDDWFDDFDILVEVSEELGIDTSMYKTHNFHYQDKEILKECIK